MRTIECKWEEFVVTFEGTTVLNNSVEIVLWGLCGFLFVVSVVRLQNSGVGQFLQAVDAFMCCRALNVKVRAHLPLCSHYFTFSPCQK